MIVTATVIVIAPPAASFMTENVPCAQEAIVYAASEHLRVLLEAQDGMGPGSCLRAPCARSWATHALTIGHPFPCHNCLWTSLTQMSEYPRIVRYTAHARVPRPWSTYLSLEEGEKDVAVRESLLYRIRDKLGQCPSGLALLSPFRTTLCVRLSRVGVEPG